MFHSCARKPYAVYACKDNDKRWKSYSDKEAARKRFLDFVKEGWEKVKMYETDTKHLVLELVKS